MVCYTYIFTSSNENQFHTYRKTSNKQPTNAETPAFNRDPAFIEDQASVRTRTSSPLRLLMSFVPMFPVYVNFTLHVNSQPLWLAKQRNYLYQHYR